MPYRLFDVPKVPVTVERMEHSTEVRKEKETRVVILTCRVQPFDAKWATAFHSEVKRTLFKMNHPDPHDHLSKVCFTLNVPRQHADFYATSDTDDASLRLEFCKVSGVYARTEKGTTGYALVFKLTFGPASARELAYCESSLTVTRFLTFHESEPSADFDDVAGDDEADPDSDAQPSLPAPDFDTTTDGRPIDTPSAAADAPGKPEAARRPTPRHKDPKARQRAKQKAGRGRKR